MYPRTPSTRPSGVAQDVGHGDPGPHFHTGGDGRVKEDLVEDEPAGRDEEVDACLRPHRLVEGLALDMEREVAHCRRVRREDIVEQAPAPQLHDAAARNRVGGERVAREARAIDQHDVMALEREQPRRGGARTAGADHDDLVGFHQPAVTSTLTAAPLVITS